MFRSTIHAGLGHKQVNQRDQGGYNADHDQGVVDAEIVLEIEHWFAGFAGLGGHVGSVGQLPRRQCEVAHI
jgi:hypothetical protein